MGVAMSWRDEVGKLLEQRVFDAKQAYRREVCSDIDDAAAWEATERLNIITMRQQCFQDGRAYGSGSGGSDDFAIKQGRDNPRSAPYRDYSNKWNLKKYG
jgi:hypothetical protein